MKDTKLFCASLCLVDPAPLSSSGGSAPSFLSARAGVLDSACRAFLHKETSFLEGVELNDITCVGDLEMHLSQCSARAHELSCIADMVARNFV